MASAHQIPYVDTPKGLFTGGGTWLRTTEAALRDYAGRVLEHVPVGTLLLYTERWLRSAGTLAVWLLLPLLIGAYLQGVALWVPAVGALVGYLVWALVSPAWVSIALARGLRWLERPGVQGLAYLLGLSYLGLQAAHGAVLIGLAGFILVRWGLVDRLATPLLRPLWHTLYQLPRADQILRAFVVRVALNHHISLPALDRMQDSILSNLRR